MAGEKQGRSAAPFVNGSLGRLTDRWAKCHVIGALDTLVW